jgi:uncharacterized protein YgfB (UPF0149 family)
MVFLFMGGSMADLELSFDDMADLSVELESIVSPSELHGMLVGQLSAGQRYNKTQWIKAAIEILQIDDVSEAVQQKELFQFYEQTLQQLEDADMSFALLLPDDEGADFNEILDSVALWCSGFLVGLAMGGPRDFDEETTEVLHDFASISQMGEEENIDEESQHALFDVIEYVRVAALSLFLNSGASPSANSATLH